MVLAIFNSNGLQQINPRIDSGGLGIGIDARTSYAAFAASFLSAVKAASESYPILHGNIIDGDSIPYAEDFFRKVTRLRQTFRIPHFIAYRAFLRRCFGVPIPQIPLRRCTRKPKPELDRLGTHLVCACPKGRERFVSAIWQKRPARMPSSRIRTSSAQS